MPGKPQGKPNKTRMGRLDRKRPTQKCPECGGRYYTKTCMVCEVKAK